MNDIDSTGSDLPDEATAMTEEATVAPDAPRTSSESPVGTDDDAVAGASGSDLDEGDSFQFPSSLPHALSNPHAEPAKVVWIMSVLDSHI